MLSDLTFDDNGELQETRNIQPISKHAEHSKHKFCAIESDSESCDDSIDRKLRKSPDAGDRSEAQLRPFTRGHPPKASGLEMARNALLHSRRSTLADVSELDHKLAASKVLFKGEYYLPLTARVMRHINSFILGLQPIADLSVFNKMILNHEINELLVDDIEAAFKVIGAHCTHIAILSPIYISKLGDLFLRNRKDDRPANDWLTLFKEMPNLSALTLKHPLEASTTSLRKTLVSLQAAIQAAKKPESVSIDVSKDVAAQLEKELAALQSLATGQ